MGGPGKIDGALHPETDNFGRCHFENEDGVSFESAEQYYQWCKCIQDRDRAKILAAGAGVNVWYAGQRVRTREDWEIVKVRCMLEGNRLKFEQNPEFQEALVATEGRVSFRASSKFWCRWNGSIMELLRAEFRNDGDRDARTIRRINGLIARYEAKQRRALGVEE